MNKTIFTAGVLVVGILSLAVFWPQTSCDAASSNCDASQQASPKQSKASTIQAAVQKGDAVLIDVREPAEFAAGHADGAKNIPLGTIEAGRVNGIDKSKKLYVYCRSGRRAEAAKIALTDQGYTEVESLGGLQDWQSLGGKLVR